MHHCSAVGIATQKKWDINWLIFDLRDPSPLHDHWQSKLADDLFMVETGEAPSQNNQLVLSSKIAVMGISSWVERFVKIG